MRHGPGKPARTHAMDLHATAGAVSLDRASLGRGGSDLFVRTFEHTVALAVLLSLVLFRNHSVDCQHANNRIDPIRSPRQEMPTRLGLVLDATTMHGAAFSAAEVTSGAPDAHEVHGSIRGVSRDPGAWSRMSVCRVMGPPGVVFCRVMGPPRLQDDGATREGAVTEVLQGHGASSEEVFAASRGQHGRSDLIEPGFSRRRRGSPSGGLDALQGANHD